MSHMGYLIRLHGLCLKYLTCAHKSGRVRVPPPICPTHCSHPPSWNKPWVALEDYLSSLQHVLVRLDGTIVRGNRSPTTDWNSNAKIIHFSVKRKRETEYIANDIPDPTPWKKTVQIFILSGHLNLGVECSATQICKTTAGEAYITCYPDNSTVHKTFEQHSYVVPN